MLSDRFGYNSDVESESNGLLESNENFASLSVWLQTIFADKHRPFIETESQVTVDDYVHPSTTVIHPLGTKYVEVSSSKISRSGSDVRFSSKLKTRDISRSPATSIGDLRSTYVKQDANCSKPAPYRGFESDLVSESALLDIGIVRNVGSFHKLHPSSSSATGWSSNTKSFSRLSECDIRSSRSRRNLQLSSSVLNNLKSHGSCRTVTIGSYSSLAQCDLSELATDKSESYYDSEYYHRSESCGPMICSKSISMGQTTASTAATGISSNEILSLPLYTTPSIDNLHLQLSDDEHVLLLSALAACSEATFLTESNVDKDKYDMNMSLSTSTDMFQSVPEPSTLLQTKLTSGELVGLSHCELQVENGELMSIKAVDLVDADTIMPYEVSQSLDDFLSPSTIKSSVSSMPHFYVQLLSDHLKEVFKKYGILVRTTQEIEKRWWGSSLPALTTIVWAVASALLHQKNTRMTEIVAQNNGRSLILPEGLSKLILNGGEYMLSNALS